MVEYYDFAKKLRSLARRADTFNHSRQQILEELVAVAEKKTLHRSERTCGTWSWLCIHMHFYPFNLMIYHVHFTHQVLLITTLIPAISSGRRCRNGASHAMQPCYVERKEAKDFVREHLYNPL